MTNELLTFLSHNFCVNCCGDMQKLNCDGQNKTCSKLANFLVGCNIYKEPINEEELDELAEEFANKYSYPHTEQNANLQCGYKVGYKQAWEDKQ